MTIYVYPADRYGCGYYRLIWPAKALIAQGHNVVIKMPDARDGIGGDVNRATGEVVAARVPDDADAVVLQRVSMSRLGAAIPLLRKQGIAVIVDMDDDLNRIDQGNPAYWNLRKDTGHSQHNAENAHKACLAATLVTVSTPRLLQVYAPHGRGVVLENRIPEAFLAIPHEDSDAFGWPGSVHSHPNDLQVIGPAASRLIREGARYWGVGPNYGFEEGDGRLARALGLDFEPETSGNVDFDQYALTVARMGIGVAPLADTVFNASKSWLKTLEMMACGVPWVASPRPEYARLAKLTGVGLLAAQPKDWYRLLKLLIKDAHLREGHSWAGRQMARDFTIEGNAWHWAQAWAEAIGLERRARKITNYARR